VVFNSLRLSFYASPDEKFYSLPKESLKVLSGYYVDTFEELDKAIRSGSYKNGIKNALVSLDLEYKDEVISNIVEHLKYSGVNEGRSIVKVGNSEFLFSFKREGNSYLVAYTKIDERITYLRESLSGILRVFSKIEFLFESFFSNYIVYFILLINIPSLFLSLLFAYLSSEYISASISNLARGMSEVSKGNLNVSVSDNFAFGEIKDLIRSFNDMVVKLREYQYRLMKMERIELWREIARKFAHEIKNPLTPIKLTLQRLMLLSDSPKLKENLIPSLKVILEEVDRIDNLVSQLSNFAKISMPVKTKFEVLDLVLSVKELFSGHNVEFNIQVDGSLKVNADYDQMKQCLINLVKNGIEAQKESPRIDIKAFRRGDFVVISVKDYGEGIPEDIKKEIFKPYTTTKRSGSGLGLSIVETIVMNHGGKVYFESELGKGSEFFIELPVE
jgi:nitrogen fixation/metabolism regulation signal transduction histidine kinase